MQHKSKALLQPVQSAPEQTLTNYQSAYLIKETEMRLEAHMKKITELEPSLQDYYNAYLELKKEYDGYKEKVEADKQMLELFSRLKNGVHPSQTLRVLRSESHNEMKPREKRKLVEGKREYVPWTDYAVDILTIERKFIKPYDLFEMTVNKFKIEEHYQKQGKEFKMTHVRWSAINVCWLGNCKLSSKGSYKSKLVYIEDRFGLKDWVTDDMKLRPDFIVSNHKLG
jgi:hypothetical protein